MDAAQREEYEEQLADISEKQLLLECMAELKAIRVALTDATAESAQTARYACATCGATVPAEERQDHLTDEHNAPLMDVEKEFERL